MTLEHEVTIARPPEVVFDYLAQPENLPEWQQGILGVERDSGEPVATGTRFKQRIRFLGREAEATLEVTAYEPGRRFDVKTLTGPFPFEVGHALAAEDGGTRLTVTGRGQPGGFFRLGERLIRREAQKRLRDDFARLKEILESRG